MLNKLLDYLIPERVELRILIQSLDDMSKTVETQRIKIQKLEDTLSQQKTKYATEASKLAITSHAVHRYRERCGGTGTDDEIYKMLMKLLLQQLYTMDRLPDGGYDLKRGVRGTVVNNTLVTILPPRDIGKPRLR